MIRGECTSSTSNQICSDAGASVTMTPDKWRVTNFKSIKKVVNVANGQSIHAIGVGTINNLDNVLVVPDLKDTLISVSQLDKLGYYTVYGNGEVNVYDRSPGNTGSTIIGMGKLKENGLYYFNNLEFLGRLENQALVVTRGGKNSFLDPGATFDEVEVEVEDDVEVDEDLNLNHHTKPINKRKLEEGQEISKSGHYSGSTSINDINKSQHILDTLHRSLGMSKKRIVELAQKEAVDGIDLKKQDLKYLNTENSTKWYEGNSKSIYLPARENILRNYNVGELIAGDIGARYPVIQRNGNEYPFIFVDIISKQMFLYGGKSKNDAFKIMKLLGKVREFLETTIFS